jgi:NMD protein affecting ribosome stability and mRNA decay
MTVVWKSKAEIKKIYGVPTCHTCGKPYSESNRWHNRPEAKRIREASRKHLESLLK